MSDKAPDSVQRPTRSIFLRILFGFLWFVVLYLVTHEIIGGIVGGIAGASMTTPTPNFEAGFTVGRQAAREVWHKYGLIVFLSRILLFAILCGFQVLPGVGKYKKLKQT